MTVAEDGGSAPFTVSLSRQSGAAVTVAYETSDWTATAGSDYTATSGRLTFAPGETRKTIAVPVLADDEEEGDEIFTVRLSDARNAALADHEGTGTIRDDEHGALEPMDRVTTELDRALRPYGGGSGRGCTRRADAVRAGPPVGGGDSGPPVSALAVYALHGWRGAGRESLRCLVH